jgi:hypothetical protein
MSLLSQIHQGVLAEQVEINAMSISLAENCVQLQMSTSEVVELMESAEEFLGQLAVNLQNNKLPKDASDGTLRNNMSMLTALDLLRFAQSRTNINANSIRNYLQIVQGVSRHLDGNNLEVKIMQNLDKMVDKQGQHGMEVRDKYIQMATSQDTSGIVREINKLKSQYQQIQAKLQQQANAEQPAANAQPSTQPAVG